MKIFLVMTLVVVHLKMVDTCTVNEEDTCNNVKWCDHEAVLLHG